jgi:hypothetical protein
VAIFDPQRLAHAPGHIESLRWSPVRGCQRPQTAMVRARALCADSAAGTENANYWQQQTYQAVRWAFPLAGQGSNLQLPDPKTRKAWLPRWAKSRVGRSGALLARSR